VGCFIPRPEKSTFCRLKYYDLEGTIGDLYIRDPAFEVGLGSKAPLDKRGWVLQEKLLSPRIIHYGAQQLYWVRRQATTSQDHKFIDTERRFTKQALDFHGPANKLPCNLRDRDSEYLLPRERERAVRMGQWYKIVQEYSDRSLSSSSDKLPAIAGIAKVFEVVTGYSYIAGLWREDILSGLLWRRGRDSGDTSISDKLPSWSWARFTGKIKFWVPGIWGLAVLITTCRIQYVSYGVEDRLGRYGELRDSRIELQGHIRPVECREIPDATVLFTKIILFAADGTRLGSVFSDIPNTLSSVDNLFCYLVHSGNGHSDDAVGLMLAPAEGQVATFRHG
jgi:hypothetical protein